jgi:hypothetical protein
MATLVGRRLVPFRPVSLPYFSVSRSRQGMGMLLEDEDGAGPGRIKVKQFLEIAMLSLKCAERRVCFLLLEGSPTGKAGSPLA